MRIAVVFNNLVFLMMIWRSKTSEYYRQMNLWNEQHIQNELKYFQIYKQAQDDVRKFRHDIKHHNSRIRYMPDTVREEIGKVDVGENPGFMFDVSNWVDPFAVAIRTVRREIDCLSAICPDTLPAFR